MNPETLQNMIENDIQDLLDLPIREMFYYHEIEDKYEEFLDDCCEQVELPGGFKIGGGRALRLCDETAFRCGCSDWASEYYVELGGHEGDMSQAEFDHYCITESRIMYCHVDEVGA